MGNEEDEDISSMWLNALSDSEDPSDQEGGTGSTREKQAAHSSVRFAALRLLLLLIKVRASTLFISDFFAHKIIILADW